MVAVRDGKNLFAASVGGLSLFVATTSALAQANLPGSVDAGQIERRFEQPQAPASTETRIQAPRREGVTPPAGSEQAKFTLASVKFEGMSIYRPDDFVAVFGEKIGKSVSIQEIYAIAQAVTDRYAADGYPLAQAVVPPQTIGAEGVVRIAVVEGYVDQVVIEGDVEGDIDLLRAYGEKIKASRPLKAADLERYLLLVEDLPGVTVSGVLRPSQQPGAADLVFKLAHKSVDLFATLDNRGSKYVGPWQAVVGGTLNSGMGLYEKTGLVVAGAAQIEEMKYVQLSHEQAIGPEGTRLSGDASYTTSQPGSDLKDTNVDSTSRTLGVGISHPVLRSRRENFNLTGRVEVKDVKTLQEDVTLSEDRLRVLRTGATYDWVDTVLTPAVTVMSLEASQGLEVMGARPAGSPNLSRSKGHPDFFKLTADANRLQRIVPDVNLLMAATAQWAGTSLLSSEQFSFGGSAFGRGFDPAEVTGDSGVAGKLELQYVGGELPFAEDYTLYAFYDVARLWSRKQPDFGEQDYSAASTGVGVRVNLTSSLSTNLELAKPVVHGTNARGEEESDWRAYFGLIARY